MNIFQKLRFHILKTGRMFWYNIRYRIFPWKNVKGIWIPVTPAFGYSVLRFIDNGEYEQHEVALIRQYLEPSDKVLELGSGIGFISACCAKIAGNENVFTFEGNPAMAPFIQKLYEKNGVNPGSEIAMLGENEGEQQFSVHGQSFLASSRAGEVANNTTAVPEKDLNKTIASIRPTYLVMDIEGGEYDIMKIIDFQTVEKVQLELHPAVLQPSEIDFIFKKLEKANFKMIADGSLTNNYFFKRAIA